MKNVVCTNKNVSKSSLPIPNKPMSMKNITDDNTRFIVLNIRSLFSNFLKILITPLSFHNCVSKDV